LASSFVTAVPEPAVLLPTFVAATAAIWIAALTYGAFRLHQTNVLSPGPRILLVQTNVSYSHAGAPSLTREQIVERHFALTRGALSKESEPPPQLIVFSEAMMPPLNPEARTELRRATVGPFITQTHEQLASLAASANAAIVTGGYYVGGWKALGPRGGRVGDDRRNAAFFYAADGTQSSARYDKIELVPFAESLPWPGASEWIHSMFLFFAAPNARQPDTPGDAGALTVFAIDDRNGARFVTPICFENVDGPFIAKMICAQGAGKRADFIANLTNDGWFSAQEHAQHLQAVVFRAIENRIPIARASNTGISAFVDSSGRIQASLPADVEGTLVQSITLDRRTTLYTQFPHLFPILCAVYLIAAVATKRLRRR
jgi:apolipoprotein N-acyltransferase